MNINGVSHMADDWQVGDLAVCVDASPCRCTHGCGADTKLEEGRVYRVIGVIPPIGFETWVNLDIGLGYVGNHRGRVGAVTDRFRKIHPDAHEACEDEFVTLLKRSRVSA